MVFPVNHKHRRRTEGTSLTGGKGMGYVYAEIQLVNPKSPNMGTSKIKEVSLSF